MNGARFAIFLSTVLAVWAVLHLYVFHRLSSIPWVESHVSRRGLFLTGGGLWLSYIVARVVGSWNLPALAYPLEFLASTWMGVLFLLFASLAVVDLLTLGGVLFTQWAPHIRTGAVLLALVLALVAQVQGLRSPGVTRHEVKLSGLPADRDGMQLVAVSDLHLGRLLGERWLRKRIAQVGALSPDVIVAVGDVVDGNAKQLESLADALAELDAPLGVWAVSGNHEFYEGIDTSLDLLRSAGWQVLRDEWAVVTPGLVFAGVDDWTGRPRWSTTAHPLADALDDRPEGAAVLLSHSPMFAGEAADRGAQLMISGHTHAGQIWPFNYLVRLRYRLVSGRYEVGGMPVLVCRGTGTWGPRMRLWQRSEILHITLRAER
jgi:predicted MPP superfamily phosphohydrolase